jgi:hypothetical protein
VGQHTKTDLTFSAPIINYIAEREYSLQLRWQTCHQGQYSSIISIMKQNEKDKFYFKQLAMVVCITVHLELFNPLVTN